jgi:hypothetical protein
MTFIATKPHRLIERILAIVLALAACLKAQDLLSSFGHQNANPIDRRTLEFLLIAMELSLALWLAIGGIERTRFGCAIVCFTVLAAAAFFETAQSASSCGCFGRVKVPPAITGTFDLCSVMALWLTRPTWLRQVAFWSRRAAFAGTAALIVLATAVFTFAHSRQSSERVTVGGPVVLDPTSWVNQKFPLFSFIDGDEKLKTGRWLLVLYHFDCDECRHAIPGYRSLAESMDGQIDPERVAFIAIPPVAPSSQDPGYATANTLHFALREDRDWIATTPLVVSLRDGRVLAVTDGEQAANPPEVWQLQ